VERIEEQHLRNIISKALAQNPGRNETRLRYFLATIVLRHYLGEEWSDEYVKPEVPNVDRGSRSGRLFLRTDYSGPKDGHRHLERIERLAELLYNLQDVQGIEGRRASIREGAIESTFAELEFAGHFARRAIQMRFLDRSGVKKSDYDFDAIEGTMKVCCEVKCKLESTDLGEKTIINTLEAARKQTPAERAVIIGLKIPETWISEPPLAGMFESVLRSYFRNSRRIVSVVVRWEEMYVMPSNDGLLLYKFRPYPNEGSRHLTEEVLQLIQRLVQPAELDWTKFREVVSAFMADRLEGEENSSRE